MGVNYITESFLHNQSSVPASTTGVYNVNFSCNPRSAKYILACHRLETDVLNVDQYSLGCRSSMALSQYQWILAGVAKPSQPIQLAETATNKNWSQGFANILDCLGQVGSINHSTLLTVSTARTGFYDSTQTVDGKYVSGLCLEQFNSASNSSIYSGENLQTIGQITYQPTMGTATAAAYRVDLITAIDCSFHFTADGRCFSLK